MAIIEIDRIIKTLLAGIFQHTLIKYLVFRG